MPGFFTETATAAHRVLKTQFKYTDYFVSAGLQTSYSTNFEYDLCQGALETYPGISASSVVWGNELEGTARELLAAADSFSDDGAGGFLADAVQFLSDLLANGPLPASVIKEEAASAGTSSMTMRRTKQALGIKASKIGMKGGWEWCLPRCSTEDEDAQQKKGSTFGDFEHLCDELGLTKVDV